MFLLRGAEMGFNRRFVSRVGSDEAIGPGGRISNWETLDVFCHESCRNWETIDSILFVNNSIIRSLIPSWMMCPILSMAVSCFKI